MDKQLLTVLQTAIAHWKEGPVVKIYFWCRFCKCAMGRHAPNCIVPPAQAFLAENGVELDPLDSASPKKSMTRKYSKTA
jgi:hypothetical protein